MEQMQNYAQLTVPLTTSGDRWASGKLLGNVLNACAGATQGRLASPHWHSVPWDQNRAYSEVRFTKAEAVGMLFRRPRRVLPWLVRLLDLFQQRL